MSRPDSKSIDELRIIIDQINDILNNDWKLNNDYYQDKLLGIRHDIEDLLDKVLEKVYEQI